jgi:hypothetical protein
MLRRAGMLAMSAGLAFVGFTTVGTADAATPRVRAHGAMICDWASGKIKLHPKFVNGGTTPGVVKFSGELGNCRDDSGDEGPTPAGITGGKVTGSIPVPTNACTTDDEVIVDGVTVRIRWTGTQKVAPSVLTSADSGYQVNPDDTYFSIPADIENTGADVTGSFEGGVAQLTGSGLEFGPPIELACTPKTKGLKGSGGVKRFELNDNLAVMIASPANNG